MKKVTSKGFTLIEIMLSIALLAIFIPALIYALGFSTFTVSQGEKFTIASSAAQEQMEAVIKLKNENGSNWDWVNTPDYTSTGEYYQPQLVSGAWQLGSKTTIPSETDGFTKVVEINQVKRCAKDLCDDSWGITDPHSRKVTVKVTWKENGQDQTVSLTSLLTNI